jgi:hypothetical protein
LAGATVRVVTSGAQIPAVLTTDGCGFFRALGLQARGSSPLVQVEISHPTIGSQVYQAYLEPGAHGFRDFTLTDPVPPPAPEGDGQPPEPDPPLELPPPPEPVVVVAQPGDVTTAPIIEIEYVTVENGEDPCAGASPPPVQGGGCETEPEPETTRVTIVSPPDGGVVPAELRQQLETPMAGDVLRGIKVHVDGAAQGAANAVRARVNAIGSQVVFDSQPYAPTQADNLSILAHEVQHTAQTAANAVGAQAVTIDVEVTDAQGRVADAASVSLHMRREHPDAPGANAASVIGQVVDQATRDGIAGIAVVVEETGDKAYTDPNGLYQFPVLPPGPLTIGVEVGE